MTLNRRVLRFVLALILSLRTVLSDESLTISRSRIIYLPLETEFRPNDLECTTFWRFLFFLSPFLRSQKLIDGFCFFIKNISLSTALHLWIWIPCFFVTLERKRKIITNTTNLVRGTQQTEPTRLGRLSVCLIIVVIASVHYTYWSRYEFWVD